MQPLWERFGRPTANSGRGRPLLCRLDQAVDDSTGLSTCGRVRKEPVFASHHERLDAALGAVIADLKPPSLQIPEQIWPLRREIV